MAAVIVVGAGPTGLTAAALLARHGLDCVVVDRRPAPHPQPRAVHLDDEVCRILASIGLADEFAAISRPGRGLRLLDADLRVLAEFRRDAAAGRHGWPEANMFDQPDLERILRRKVTVADGVEVTELTQHGDHVRVNGERFDYALGCDGANSFVRDAIGASMRDLGFAQRWLVVDIDTDEDLGRWDGVHQVCDTRRAATFMRVGETRYRWEFRLQRHESAADYQDLARIRPLLAAWTTVEELRLRRVAEYTFRAQVADKWRDNRVFLLGDAAHLTPPFIGQGLGAGLRDAANLAWKLASVHSGQLPASILDTYQVERQPHVRTMIRLAKLLGVAMTEGGEIGDLLRKVLMPRLHLLPGLRNRVLSSETPALRRSELVLRPRLRRSLAGTLCPAGNPDRITTVTAESNPELADWLRRGRARAAVVRPDGTVLRTMTTGG
ncbi:bifunctional 3-(3-hydroxy-phenyl)propionate/3-hydroxycinnamic acid hydroxylase [Kutzneria sp. NPDC052558]|uniref:bifunctional 3-(3-hydroxy-phenyl)propionate/3-hydroxycinnamic acid hydroxylase n=1 Tax=Kutzneria sp. NPDC052558 TaxID=3364121 RepID=UPI0037C68002